MTTWVIAHRGASDRFPENTLIAFQEALEQGADGVECDVHLTADGEVVVIHDSTVDRTTDGSGVVAEMTLAQIEQLDAGSWKHGRFAGQRVPTLHQVAELVRDRAQLFIELRGHSPELPQRVIDLLRGAGVTGQAWLFTAHRPTLEALRRLAPEVRVRWREGMESGDFVLTWPERLTEATMAVYRERGMAVFTTIVDQTSNSQARRVAVRMYQLEVEGIICNRVELLRELFAGMTRDEETFS